MIDQDIVFFILGVLLLISYLVFSAKTEMGTQIHLKWPWKK